MFLPIPRVTRAIAISLACATLAHGSAISVVGAQGPAPTTVRIVEHPAFGPILTNEEGAALYTWIVDAPGVSTCYEACLIDWPVLEARGGLTAPLELDGRLDTIDRPDGIRQVTYDRMPLYTYARDTELGRGDGSINAGALWPVAALGTVRPTVQITRDSDLGYILTDGDGMTLYTWGADEPEASKCTASCASIWTPVMPADRLIVGAGLLRVLGTITRDDGSLQATYNRLPLYRYQADLQPGDARGDGINAFGGTWQLATMVVFRN
jgi:predicted lipoprotein with Yx(FWY)xxD motif